MATIKKRADELKPGDVITSFHGASNVTCPAIVVTGYSNGRVLVVNELVSIWAPAGAVFIGYSQAVEVEAPDLTPAQQHAEELAEFARHATSGNYAPEELQALAFELFDKIKPPEPPTLEEALEALSGTVKCIKDDAVRLVDGKSPYVVALDILDRARREGMLKGGA